MSKRQTYKFLNHKTAVTDLDPKQIAEIFKDKDVEYHFKNGILSLKLHNENNMVLENKLLTKCLNLITLYFLSPDTKGELVVCSPQYFEPTNFKRASSAFFMRCLADYPASLRVLGCGEKTLDWLYRQSTGNLQYNHPSDYIQEVFPFFWERMFGECFPEMYLPKVISVSSNDIAEQRLGFEKASISLERAKLLHLLTYTKVFKETEKSQSCQWVIENYDKYLPQVIAAEKDVLQKIYGRT